MANRFFDTELCEKKWYHNLTPIERCFFHDVLLSKCDCVGVWTPNEDQVKYLIGEYDYSRFPNKCKGNIEVLPNGKWWLVDFCDFQYGELSETCKPHKKYLAQLRKHGLLDRILKGYSKGIETLQEKEEDKTLSSLSFSCVNSYDSNKQDVSNGSNRINMHIASWNANENLPRYRFNSLTMRDEDRHGALRTMTAYTDDEISQAIANYAKIKGDVDMEPFPVYATFAGFMVGGVEKYADDAKPFDRCRKRDAQESGLEALERIRRESGQG